MRSDAHGIARLPTGSQALTGLTRSVPVIGATQRNEGSLQWETFT